MPRHDTHNLFSIGIDIGSKGAIVIQHPYSKTIEVFAMPTISGAPDYLGLVQILEPYAAVPCHVVIEDLHSIFGAGAASNFSFGAICGATEMVLVSLKIPYTKIRAVDWQKELFVGVRKVFKKIKKGNKVVISNRNDTKAMALLAAKRLFPAVSLTDPLSKRATVPHDGIVDALLISEYCRRHFK